MNLEWDASPDADVTGYRIRYGSISGNYTQFLEIGKSTSATVSGLNTGSSYFFVVTAVNASGFESQPSNEVMFMVPLAPGITTTTVTAEKVETRSAILAGNVSANGNPTSVSFEYGLSTAYGQVTTSVEIGAGSEPVNVTAPVTGLLPHTVYYYRMIARNQGGISYSQGGTFKTANSSPVLSVDRAFSVADAATPITLAVLANDSDADGDQLVVTRLSRPSAGRVRINSDGTITYTPKLSLATFGGVDTFTYTVSDGFGGTANSAVTIRNPFYRIKGSYDTLLAGPPGEDGGTGGYLKVTLSNNGSFSGMVAVSGNSYSFKGAFKMDGSASVSIARPELPPLVVSLLLDTEMRTNAVTARVADSTSTYQGLTERVLFNSVSDPCPQAGKYTLLLPAPEALKSDPAVPKGAGCATLAVTENGTTTLAGRLGDGTAFSAGANVRRNGTLPLYVGLGGKPATRLYGILTFREVSDTSDLDGMLTWIKPARAGDPYYSGGFVLQQSCWGSFYIPPFSGERIIDTAAGGGVVMEFSGGNLPDIRQQTATLSTTNAVLLQSPVVIAGLNVTVVPSDGTFSGTFTHPVNGKSITFRGVFFQKQNLGAGVFLGTNESGNFRLTPISLQGSNVLP